MQSSARRGKAFKRVLVRGVNWLGDAVMSTPALIRLREFLSDAEITMLTPQKLADLWRNHPAVNDVIPFGAGESVFAVAKRLRAKEFDVALVFPNSPRSAMEVWLAGIPERIGYSRAWRNWFLTHRVLDRDGAVKMHKRSRNEIRELIDGTRERGDRDLVPGSHHLYQYLHLVGEVGAEPEPCAPVVNIESSEVEALESRFDLREMKAPGRPVLGLNPGAEYGAAKRWPTDRFGAAAQRVRESVDCHWIITGGKGDVEPAAAIERELRSTDASRIGAGKVTNLAGKTSLRELCAAFKLCRIVLTNDTGPMHVAAAVGTPVVVPFGSTSPELTGPGLPGDSRHALIKTEAVCAPCFLRDCPIDLRCMNSIAVDRVVEAVLDRVNKIS